MSEPMVSHKLFANSFIRFLFGGLCTLALIWAILILLVPFSSAFGEINATSSSSGNSHSFFIKNDGSLWGFGANGSSQLGDFTTTDRTNPVKLEGEGVLSVAAGEGHSLYIKTDDNSLWAMGANESGQLGNGTTDPSDSSVQADAGPVSRIAAGQSHSLFIRGDGTLWAMGANESGQLGNGNTTNQNTSVQADAGPVSRIAAGQSHSLFVKTNGSLHTMGNNLFGQLGNGTTTQPVDSVQVLASEVSDVSAGQFHSLFIKTDGSLWAMGRNNSGQLGDGTLIDRSSPVMVVESGVSYVTAGDEHTLYLKTDGSLWGMGFNGFGQLGDGTTSNHHTPITIESSGVTSVFAGKHHTLYVKSDGSVWAMGKNDNGQLGDGTVNNKNSRSAVKAYVMTIGVEADGNGTASGGGQFAYGQTGSFSSSPNSGYIFSSWNGPLSGYSSTGSLTISGDIEANASFDPSPYDGDGDGLTDYYETVIFGSNPNSTDSDGDGFSDLEENNTGLDPNVADTLLRNLFNSLTNDAYNSTFDEGVQEIYTDRKSYDLNNSSEVQYEYGHADGLSHAVQYQEDNNDSLYTLTEVNSARSEYQVSTTAFIREEITNGLSALGYLDSLRKAYPPHVEKWHYQTNMGWLWTNQETFPFVYFSDPENSANSRWLYSLHLAALPDGSFYDYLTGEVISP